MVASNSDYYLEELDKIWAKLTAEQKVAKDEFERSASYQRAIKSERQVAGIAKLSHVINFVKNIMEIEESVVVFCHHKIISQDAQRQPQRVLAGLHNRGGRPTRCATIRSRNSSAAIQS